MHSYRLLRMRLTSLGLSVPSVVEPQERNFLINPAHPHYASIAVVIEILDFEFDPRLF